MGHWQSSARDPSGLSSSVSLLTLLLPSMVVCEDRPLITPNAAGRISTQLPVLSLLLHPRRICQRFPQGHITGGFGGEREWEGRRVPTSYYFICQNSSTHKTSEDYNPKVRFLKTLKELNKAKFWREISLCQRAAHSAMGPGATQLDRGFNLNKGILSHRGQVMTYSPSPEMGLTLIVIF